jgi:hypothetical protein
LARSLSDDAADKQVVATELDGEAADPGGDDGGVRQDGPSEMIASLVLEKAPADAAVPWCQWEGTKPVATVWRRRQPS